MRDQLAAAVAARVHVTAPPEHPKNLDETDFETTNSKRTIPYNDYAELAQKYEQLRTERKNIKQCYDILINKYRSTKDNTKAWNKYIEEFRAKRAREKSVVRESTALETPGHVASRNSSDMVMPGTAVKTTISRPSVFIDAVSPMAPPLLSPLSGVDDGTPRNSTPKPSDPTNMLSSSSKRTTPLRMQEGNLNGAKPIDSPNLQTDITGPYIKTEPVDNDGMYDTNIPNMPSFSGLPGPEVLNNISHDASEKIFSSQATVDEPETNTGSSNLNLFAQENDESPVVVSARSVRHHKRQPLSSGEQTANVDNPTLKSVKIKKEHQSSPSALKYLAHIARNNTVDLDEIGHRVNTPRKRKRLPGDSFDGGDQSELCENMSSKSPLDTEIGRRQSSKKRRNKDDTSDADFVAGAHGDTYGVIKSEEPILTGPHTPGNFMQSKSDARGHSFPPPASMSKQSLISAREWRNSSGRRHDDSHGADAVPTVAEDGETRKSKRYSTRQEQTPKDKDRLMALLQGNDSPFPEIPSVPRDSNKSAFGHRATGSPFSHASTSSPNRLAIPSDSSLEERSKSAPKSNNVTPAPGKLLKSHIDQTTISRDTSGSDRKPLRSRSLSRLSREDFVINPQFNKGLDYAFQETIRKVAERQCLPGCIRPECCGGHFRNLVEIGGLRPTIERGLWDDPIPKGSSEEIEEEERVLKWFLGASYTRKKSEKTNRAERKEMLVQARTKLLADRAGKHRQAYERRKTPPLFWETDMPSTQDFQDARGAADEEERREVEKRWFDAMRSGGYWKFRDE